MRRKKVNDGRSCKNRRMSMHVSHVMLCFATVQNIHQNRSERAWLCAVLSVIIEGKGEELGEARPDMTWWQNEFERGR